MSKKPFAEHEMEFFARRAMLAVENERAINRAVVQAIHTLVACAEKTTDREVAKVISEVSTDLLNALDAASEKAQEIGNDYD
jgi:uncharacterized protein YtpQ (UPF0354 family)